jgi:CxxC-x17-CxxC domain-containing protein
MYIIGKTGMGKTTLLEHLVLQDIQNGHGVAYVDPHGDTAEKIVSMVPPERVKDVVYINPADLNFPVAFNVMERVDPEYRHLVASGLVGVFKKLWADSWGPRLEYILRNAILALLEYPGSTLLGVMRLLVDKKYQKEVVAHVEDPVVKSFWVDEFTKWNERVLQEVVAPIQNKVGQFLSAPLIRNIVGQTESSFNIRDIMDQKKILVLNLSKGRIGEDNSALLGAMMITKIQLAAMGRVDIPEHSRNDFYLYVDEFQNFATESFANILSEARKYRLNLILANQYINQIDEIVRDAIFGNAGTLISFRVGATDAEFLEKEFEPVFMQNDFVNLPKYNIYLKLMIDGVAGDAFSATTLPPIEGERKEDMSEKVIQYTREHYARSRAEVEEQIKNWSFSPTVSRNFMEPKREYRVPKREGGGEREKEKGEVNQPSTTNNHPNQTQALIKERESHPEREKVQKPSSEENLSFVKERKLYSAVCQTCNMPIQVPFEPDEKRPTFCREHLKEYQREMAKKEQEREESLPNRQARLKEERRDDETTVSPKSYESGEMTMSLKQMKYVAPKKFRPLSKPSSKEIRLLLESVKQGEGKNVKEDNHIE